SGDAGEKVYDFELNRRARGSLRK
ncbi:DUF4102 domain-containing protein, partial [Salmonella enterica subsp. enterica serovar Montevideo]|nr:DUF4102 domain-containing protein [Salmonella enterica]EAA3558424.1 DUF4102 domain-containing protein [Salmonella enterica subsp. enterica serovar Montevideo]EBA2373464.1 DUF4102 domain-containing protein [Salmonella enterica subsp. enterica serovar Dublin]ECF7178122.1 DUF4102 domain-containing protein [Salmonella enterica subsp. enterica]ECK2271536.1 DUF4102 domain-containing protein [Salmonella enterica subsp. enterica serovar Braenderup]EDD5580682.1 DUF4102 domain-containing protein [Sal